MTGRMAESGTAIGIGVGPGDPELMTLKGARILSGATVVAYPAPEHGDSLARTIAAPPAAIWPLPSVTVLPSWPSGPPWVSDGWAPTRLTVRAR
mgnify:CR=1 FL=1